jgi:hypothetical protein
MMRVWSIKSTTKTTALQDENAGLTFLLTLTDEKKEDFQNFLRTLVCKVHRTVLSTVSKCPEYISA